ncbi:unnamed protein product [Cyprideis torosa]|uniref:Trehalase n=1 Tax=Cyprideis torosa TaxID=163714 RepID=A0A7R8ZHC6_9CRUS|nr:unnamed protein product [Cyprideis torosa]CAG0882251.1 unnamed protein product [Cyprideis torosa]
METHIVEITENTQTYRLARYKSEEDVPRPESYYEDVTVAEEFPENERAKIYQEIRGACESGWDFSSRWFADPNGSQGLGTLVTSSIIPVDLNSLLCRNAATLAAMYKLLGDNENATHYEELHEEFRNAIENLLWDEEQGTWFDYDLESKSRRPSFYLSMAFPLWTDCVVDPASKMNRSLQYLQLNDSVLNSPGGVPISLNPTGQQWDYPNAWAPAVLVLIEALEGGNDTAADVAEKLAQVWVRTIYTAYQNYEALFEKYNVTELGAIGSGGEYSVQEGFGWTNGVLLSLFQQYGETLSPDSENGGSGGSVST